MSIYSFFDNCSTPIGAHLVSRHVQGMPECDSSTSYFTDSSGKALDCNASLQLLSTAKTKVTQLPTAMTKNKSTISHDNTRVLTLPLDSNPKRKDNNPFAVSWGAQVGSDGGRKCEWIVLILSANKGSSSRYPWVTAYPVTENFLIRKGYLTAPTSATAKPTT